MTLPDILITKEDFTGSKWKDSIKDISKKECLHYNDVLANKSAEFKKEKDEKNSAIFALLSSVCSFHFVPDSADEPFRPLFEFANSRGLIPDDFTKNNIDSLTNLIDDIEDHELLARIADVLWILSRDHNRARQAVESYLESAKILENPESWPPAAERIERALRLAFLLRDENLIKKVVDHIEIIIKKYNGNDPLFFSSSLMDLLLEFKKGNPEDYIPICEKVIKESLDKHDWYRARIYLEIQSRWHESAGDVAKKTEALVQEAEVYVKEAENTVSSEKPSYMAASAHLQKAIEAFRRIGGHQERIDELHKKLLSYQEKIPSEMNSVSIDLDLRELAEKSRKRVKGKTLEEAIRNLALYFSSPKVDKLKERVKDLMKKHPVKFLVSGVGINSEGKVVSRKPNTDLSAGDEENADAIRAEMYEQAASIDILINTMGIVEPARKQIAAEYRGSPKEFLPFMRNNPFVPQGREVLYARALSYGLQGDFVNFLSIAVPQVENSIRNILRQSGLPTSKIDQYGIQQEKDLNEILFMEEIKKSLGEDLAFDLQGLLVIPFGANLRNREAHGLLNHDEYYSIHVSYFWWLTLRLVVLGTIMSQSIPDNKNPENKK